MKTACASEPMEEVGCIFFIILSRKHTDGNHNFRPLSGYIDPLQGSAASGVDDLDLVLRPKPGVKINHEDYESTA